LVVGLDTIVQLPNASFPDWVSQGKIIAYDTLGGSTDSTDPISLKWLPPNDFMRVEEWLHIDEYHWTLEQPVVEAKAQDALPIFSHEPERYHFIQSYDMNDSCAMIGTDRCPRKRRLHISVHACSHPRPQATDFLQEGGYRGLRIKDGCNTNGKVGRLHQLLGMTMNCIRVRMIWTDCTERCY